MAFRAVDKSVLLMKEDTDLSVSKVICYTLVTLYSDHTNSRHLRTFALIVLRASSRGSREEKCHTKVCKQIRRPRRKVKKEVEVGDS